MSFEVTLSCFHKLVGEHKSLRGQLVRGGAGSILIKIANILISLLLTVVLARILGSNGYGVYSYAIAVVTLFAIPVQMGMPTLLLREVARYDAKGDWPHLRGIIVRTLQVSIFIAILLILIAGGIWVNLDEFATAGEELRTLVAAFFLLILTTFCGLFGAGLRGLRHVIKGLLPETVIRPSILLFTILVFFFQKPESLTPVKIMHLHLLAALAGMVLAGWWLYAYLPNPVQEAKSKFETKRWLHSAGPLSLLAGAGVISSQTDIVMLRFFSTTGDVGIYRIATQGAVLVAFGLQAINMIIAPQVARMYATGAHCKLQQLVTISARLTFMLALPVAISLIFWGEYFLGVAFGHEYILAHEALAILALGQLINTAIGPVGLLLNMSGNERATMYGFLISAGANILLNLLLIPKFQICGAAIATTLSLILWNIILYCAVRKRLGIDCSIIGKLTLG